MCRHVSYGSTARSKSPLLKYTLPPVALHEFIVPYVSHFLYPGPPKINGIASSLCLLFVIGWRPVQGVPAGMTTARLRPFPEWAEGCLFMDFVWIVTIIAEHIKTTSMQPSGRSAYKTVQTVNRIICRSRFKF